MDCALRKEGAVVQGGGGVRACPLDLGPIRGRRADGSAGRARGLPARKSVKEVRLTRRLEARSLSAIVIALFLAGCGFERRGLVPPSPATPGGDGVVGGGGSSGTPMRTPPPATTTSGPAPPPAADAAPAPPPPAP